MKRTLITLASLLTLLAGCVTPAASPIPTAYPPEYLPTVIALTAEAISVSVAGTTDALNVSASETALALTPTLPTPSDTPAPTATPTLSETYTPTSIPGHDPAAIQIFAPGPMSKVVSPINLRMHIIAGNSGKAQIALYGEDGRLLTRNVKSVPPGGKGVDQVLRIPFEIPAAAEVARLTVSTMDKQGRIQSLKSVRLLLLSSGNSEITPSGNPSESVGVVSPLPEASVSDGVVTVKGDIWPFNLNPVIIELVDPKGKPITSKIMSVSTIEPQLFQVTLPYKVFVPTAARLVIRQDDDRIDGLFYLYSQEILLNP
ncbi:MAG TPA: hypothetical protein VHP14_01320 [Anaerolineales bacterium]|nr:hypothetical protein [Anaerolineales bacterium]